VATGYSYLEKTLPRSFFFASTLKKRWTGRPYRRSDYTYLGVYERTDLHGLFVPGCRIAPTSRSHRRASRECVDALFGIVGSQFVGNVVDR
jgi:hypothetical protein